MSTVFTIIGDPHITNKSLDKGQQLFELVEKKGNPAIWLGDLLDTKEVIRGKCLNAYFDYFKLSKLEHIIIVGNHDWFNLECKDHSLRVFESLENVMVVDSLEEIGPNCYALPYLHEEKDVKKELKKIPKDSVVFGHFELASFDYGNGRICDNGMELKPLKKFKRVVSGHFHKFQEKGNFMYLGTPFSHSFGESNQDKYLGTYEVDSDELTLEDTPFPKHLTFEIDCDEPYAVPEAPGHIVRIILKGNQENINMFPKDDYPDVRVIERPTDSQIDVDIEDTASNASQFQTWAKDIRQLDEETVKLGSQILEGLGVK